MHLDVTHKSIKLPFSIYLEYLVYTCRRRVHQPAAQTDLSAQQSSLRTYMKNSVRRDFLKTSASALAVASTAGLLAACGGSDDTVTPAPSKTIVEIAQADPQFSTLVAALGQASLVTALSGTGPFTVFAPTNAAFDALRQELAGAGNPPITVAALLANAKLADILKYHVLTSKVLKAQVPVATPITTFQGETISISSAFVITDRKSRTANITATDILATNGVIHVIDKVILPSVA
jgi:uncharacterized surface protein with fasciclin (FAS1) repeats